MMTYEAYMKKSLVELRKLASAMGVKDVYSYRKAALVEEMLKCPEHLESLPEQATAEAPKRRGRPPKEKKEEQTEQAPAEKKRRGRPPQSAGSARDRAHRGASCQGGRKGSPAELPEKQLLWHQTAA